MMLSSCGGRFTNYYRKNSLAHEELQLDNLERGNYNFLDMHGTMSLFFYTLGGKSPHALYDL